MGEHTMPGSNGYVQYYQQQTTTTRPVAPLAGDLSNTTLVLPSTTMLDHSNSSSPLNPKGCISKPIRRRSRSSRRTPTTLLNANASNFRALVQQFTGLSSGSTSLGTQKGPINLSFGESSGHDKVVSVNSMVSSFGVGGYNDQQTWPQQQHQQFSQEPQVYDPEQECVFSSDNNFVSDVYFTNDSYFF